MVIDAEMRLGTPKGEALIWKLLTMLLREAVAEIFNIVAYAAAFRHAISSSDVICQIRPNVAMWWLKYLFDAFGGSKEKKCFQPSLILCYKIMVATTIGGKNRYRRSMWFCHRNLIAKSGEKLEALLLHASLVAVTTTIL